MTKPTPSQRFWAKVKVGAPSECWEWVAYRERDGYGWFGIMGRNHGAHRVSYVLAYGVIPKGMQVDHICGNRACVNPAHLRLATHYQNKLHGQVRVTNKLGIKGVSRMKNQFKAEIALNGVRYYLGLWPTPEEAHAAYCRAANQLHGQFAHH